jgi:hypothetical protein
LFASSRKYEHDKDIFFVLSRKYERDKDISFAHSLRYVREKARLVRSLVPDRWTTGTPCSLTRAGTSATRTGPRHDRGETSPTRTDLALVRQGTWLAARLVGEARLRPALVRRLVGEHPVRRSLVPGSVVDASLGGRLVRLLVAEQPLRRSPVPRLVADASVCPRLVRLLVVEQPLRRSLVRRPVVEQPFRPPSFPALSPTNPCERGSFASRPRFILPFRAKLPSSRRASPRWRAHSSSPCRHRARWGAPY